MMKRNFLPATAFFILLLLSLNSFGQVPIKPRATTATQPTAPKKTYYQKSAVDTVKNTDFSLSGQYRFLLSRSRSSYGSKLINPARMDALWKSVGDTLRKERLELKNAKLKVSEQEKAISDLKNEVAGKETSLNETTSKADEISFLGISFTKGMYSTIVWTIIVVLGLALFIVIARSAKSILEAKHRTQLYDEIAAEYQAYKVKTNDQQRKLARELQDERNIVEELRSNGR